jgi:DNA-binding CsgD family transcriptional regulator/tetratricopeptide (TPR) repeat protein
VIVTTRTGSLTPPALTDLWKDGFAERIELQNLSRRETAELLAAGLDGPVRDSSANRIWQVTGGNPLYLREVVLASEETGALQKVDDEWRWDGAWAGGARLREIVAGRLGRLDPDEMTVMEMIALAGSLPLTVVTGASSSLAVQDLEARGLVKTERIGRRLEVEIAHPLHAEVVRARIPELRQRSIRQNLVDALTATGGRREADRVRIACWSIELGIEVDPLTLSLGSSEALFGIGPAVAARLEEIAPHLHAGTPQRLPAVPQDWDLAIRMARRAYERNPGIKEGATLAHALAWTGKIEESEEILGQLASTAADTDDKLRLDVQLAWSRFWGRNDIEAATSGLREALDVAERDSPDRMLLAEGYQELAGFMLNTARPAEALKYARHCADVQGVELSASIAPAPAAAALSYLGRCREAMELIDEALGPARDKGHPLLIATLLFTRAGTLGKMGKLDEARELLEWLREVALSNELLDATAGFGVLLGEIMIRQGRPLSAARILRDSAGLLHERDVLGYRPWALSALSRARSRAGEEESAAAALEEARRSRKVSRHFDISLYLAEVDLNVLVGRQEAAIAVAQQGADWSRTAGMAVEEAFALDALVRIAPAPAVVERLEELTTVTDSDLVALLAEHGRARLDCDADTLLTVSERFATMAAWGLATESAAVAAEIIDGRGDQRATKAAAAVAARHAENCEGTLHQVVGGLSGPTRLTKREREIAVLAAAGRSSKEIAERMYLSRRTVENHLYHAYVKLGVTDRSALAEALADA